LAASERLNVGDLGGNGFGSFSRKKRISAAGPNPIAVKLSTRLALNLRLPSAFFVLDYR